MEKSVRLNIQYLDNTNSLFGLQEITLIGTAIRCNDLHMKISETFGIDSDDFELFQGIKCLDYQPETDILELGLRSGMKIYAIQKKRTASSKRPKALDSSVVRNAMYGLSTMFTHSRHPRQRNKTAIVKLLEDKEAMDAIIASIDGLRDDQTALDILGNAKLLEAILDPKNVKKVMEEHVCLAGAFIAMWNSLMSSSKYSNFEPLAGPSSESQGSMEVDDGGLALSQDAESLSNPNRYAAPLQNITSLQLAAALQQTLAPNDSSSTASSPGTPRTLSTISDGSTNSSRTNMGNAASTQRHQTQSIITPEAMQQALMSTGFQHVSNSLHNESTSEATEGISEDLIQSGLDTLRTMGIVDEAASRQALIASRGDIEGAINILFGGP